ncbi:uncharacterized protein [Mytilus edulis]|uniref:uncharacterized protein n=1 Tax=Mytilus edulis TaxID=6550 RepID=UPI0039EE1FF0
MLKKEQIKKERLSRLEYEQKLAVEAHQNELKRLETRRELEVAHARLNAYSQVNTLVQNHKKTLITDIDNTLNNMKQDLETPMNQKPASPAAGMDPFNVKYVGGAARKALEGYFYNNSQTAYYNARKVLEERYGYPFIMQKAFRDKLASWPKIAPKDPIALRDIGDFLQGCRDAIPHFPSLSILNDCTENQKLPDWASLRWNREVTQSLDISATYPSFDKFVNFVVKEAKVACNPISSLYALNDKERKISRDPRTNTKVKVFATSASNDTRPNNDTSANKTLVCEYCKKVGHYIFKCERFLSISITNKRLFVPENNLCYGCLRKGHLNKDCKRKHICNTCKGKDPSCLHEERPPVRQQTSNVPDSNAVNNIELKPASSLRVSQNNVQSTSMIVPVWVSHKDKPSREILTYSLLDTQSDTTFILDDTAASLHIPCEPIRLRLSTMTSQQTFIESKRIIGLTVRSFSSPERLNINCAYTRGFIPVERAHIPTNETARQWHHLQEIAHEIPPLQSCDIGLLLGYNCPAALAPTKIVTGNENEPCAVQTSLGWSIVGYTSSALDVSDVKGISHRTAVTELPPLVMKDLVNSLEGDFAHDKSQLKKVSQEDITFLSIMDDNIRKRNDGHLEMPLPFRERPKMENNKKLAELRLNHLKRRLTNDQKYHEQYKVYMNEMLTRGDAELVTTEGKDGNTWYIPHHGVFHSKKPDKLRVVFDCSARYRGQSLNEYLLTGPDLTNGLAGVLCRFRTHPIAIMCDVEKMFHQFSVSEYDRDFLIFLWWENGDLKSSDKPLEYQMTKHLFGAASSPGCANYGLKYLAKTNEEQFLEASEFVQRNFYVDDGLTSVETEFKAIQLIGDVQQICATGGLRLHKFISNNKNVMESIPLSERAVNAQNLGLYLKQVQSHMERALGVQWCTIDDTFKFQVKVKDVEPIRRNILSIVASVFDPLGFLSPFTLKGKRILQGMCQQGIGCDDPLPNT